MNKTNAADLVVKLQAHRARLLAGLTRAVTRSALYVLAESQRVVPVDYGILKASGGIRVTGAGTAHVAASVVYTAAYAVYVHEDLDKAHGSVFNAKYADELAHARNLRRKKMGGTTGPFRHDRGANQQAKFLEGPFRRAISDGSIIAIMADEMSKP